MKKVILNQYTFYYDPKMIYFYDQRYQNVLFMKRLNDDRKSMNQYDGTQIIIDFLAHGLKFHPLWNISIEQTAPKTYILNFA